MVYVIDRTLVSKANSSVNAQISNTWPMFKVAVRGNLIGIL